MNNPKLIPIDTYGRENLEVGDIVKETKRGGNFLSYRIIEKRGDLFICNYGGLSRSAETFKERGGYEFFVDKRYLIERYPIISTVIGFIILLFILSNLPF